MSTDTPITWQVVLFLQQRLQAITTAGGYRTDIGTNVFLEKKQFQENDPPFIVVTLVKTQRTGGSNISPLQRTATFQIEAAVPNGVNNTNANQTAHLILADIEEIFSQRADQFSDRVKVVVGTDSQIEQSPDGLNAVLVTITGTANYKPLSS